MRYIERDLKSKIIDLKKEYAVILITGARQVGKSTLFETIMKEQGEETGSFLLHQLLSFLSCK